MTKVIFNRELIIIRGPSGTGKSTIAKHLGGIPRKSWFEADMFMLNEDGDYFFDRNKLGDCHMTCQSLTRLAFEKYPQVIVSNTSTSIKELNTYLDIAAELGISVRIIRTPKPWDVDTLLMRNVHNVPEEAVRRFINRYTPHEDEEEWTDMSIFK